jgi:hypothetical protein
LRALVRTCWEGELDAVDPAVGGGWSGDNAFLLADDPRAVGRSVLWARAGGASGVHLLAPSGPGDLPGQLARRAAFLRQPGPDGPDGTGDDSTWPRIRPSRPRSTPLPRCRPTTCPWPP